MTQWVAKVIASKKVRSGVYVGLADISHELYLSLLVDHLLTRLGHEVILSPLQAKGGR